jgi:hypothetical protein
MNATIEKDIELEMCCCSECGINYAVPSNYRRSRRDDHRTFYCPNGHAQHMPAKSEAEKLRDELVRVGQRLDQVKADADHQRQQREAAERRVSAARGEMTKMRNRVGNGVCPWCNRFVKQLANHMKTKHPTWHACTDTESGPEVRT